MRHRRSALRASLLLALAPCAARALPEGSPQLGPTQGLAGFSMLRVDVTQIGETIRLCSSDDGFKEPDADGLRLESTPAGTANPIAEPRRMGAEILLAPPTLTFCRADADCEGPARCWTGDLFPVPVAGGFGVCAIPLSVSREGAGYCNFGTGPGNWQTHIADEVGAWHVNFVAEPETLSPSDESTRYFAADVLRINGQPAAGGRLHTPAWRINAHRFEYDTDADFYVVAPVRSALVSGARVFKVDLQGVQGFQYQVVANSLGIESQPSKSWCQFGNPDPATLDCPFFNGGDINAAFSEHNIYLSYPDPAPAPAPAPEVGNLTFNDSVGTNSITPNGDGEQDTGTFRFSSNVNSVYRVVIDTDRNGVFDPSADFTLTGDAIAGDNRVQWDGRDESGRAIPDGRYRFQLEVTTAETHIPLVDIERNVEGFVIGEQSGPNAPVVPRRMFWDDSRLRDAADLLAADDAVTTLPNGSAVPADGGAQQRRYWRQPTRGNPDRLDANGNPSPEDVPHIYDTWVQGDRVVVSEALCDVCGEPFDSLIIGGVDERFDSDNDGIFDFDEDRDRDGVVDPNESDPRRVDTDADGLPDGVEDANRDGLRSPGETNPNDADSDDDGLSDGVEVNGQNPTNPLARDTDADGLDDGLEDADRDGVRDEGETDAARADSDVDGLPDGLEDANRNGRRDGQETDPLDPDTDDDGLVDGVEDANSNGARDVGESDPRTADTDADGLRDGVEDTNLNGARDEGETATFDADTDDGGEPDGSEVDGGRDPLDPSDDLTENRDSDLDGIPDVVEDANRNGMVDIGETDPNNPDTDSDLLLDGVEVNGGNPTSPTNPDSDADGLSDGLEDANRDGDLDGGETNPNLRDSDADGIDDGVEDLDRDGEVDAAESDPRDADTDADGVSDGVEDANRNGAFDAGETNTRLTDSDRDDLSDGAEDVDADGVVDVGETDPRDPDSDDGGELDGSEVANGRNPVDDPSDDVRTDSDLDGIPDVVEDTDQDGVFDAGETNPRNADTDSDGLPDGLEDANRNGAFDAGETDPRVADTDGDGLIDGAEDRNRNGTVDAGETDPRVADTDGDGLNDGLEDATNTNGTSDDTDGDGLKDGSEDRNLNGRVDEGETDPRIADTDGDGLNDGIDPDPLTPATEPDAGAPLANYTGATPADGCACDLRGGRGGSVGVLLPLLLVGLRRRRRR